MRELAPLGYSASRPSEPERQDRRIRAIIRYESVGKLEILPRPRLCHLQLEADETRIC